MWTLDKLGTEHRNVHYINSWLSIWNTSWENVLKMIIKDTGTINLISGVSFLFQIAVFYATLLVWFGFT